MENQITIREAVTENDVALFWEQLYIYFKRDMFSDPEDEDREYRNVTKKDEFAVNVKNEKDEFAIKHNYEIDDFDTKE